MAEQPNLCGWAQAEGGAQGAADFTHSDSPPHRARERSLPTDFQEEPESLLKQTKAITEDRLSVCQLRWLRGLLTSEDAYSHGNSWQAHVEWASLQKGNEPS